MSNFFISAIRTVVAVIAGAACSWLIRQGLSIDEAEVTAWLTPLAISGYYVVIRWLEVHVPQVGWLFGVAKQPGYSPADPPADAPGPNENI
jgi:hypothetical protein